MMPKKNTSGSKLLELTMRDVLDGLEDAASYMNYRSTPEIIEILSIESPSRTLQSKDKVVPINLPINCDIVDYLIQRELSLSA